MGKQKHQNPYDYIYDTYSPEEEEQLFAAIKPSKPKVQKTIQPTFVAESAYAPDEEQIPYFNTTENSEEAILRLEENNKELAQKYLDILSSSINRQERDFIREEIKTLIRTWGLTYVDDLEHYPLSREEKHIIRMDFYGSINQTEKTPPRTNLSERYLQFINAPQTQQAERPPQDYNLDASPTWQLFRQFPRFQKIESELKEQMQKMRIPAELLPALNAYDFSDILYNYYKEDENSPKAHLFLGARKSFIKDFIRHNETAFRKYLTQTNVDKRYIDALVDEMKRLGKTSNIMVMDPIKWKTLFKQYQKAGLIPTDEVYTPDVPQKYKDLIKEHNDYFKVAILDKEGKPLSGPEFSVHHKTAVKDAATIPDLADVNKFENLCLTIDSPYHRILHSLDMTQTIDKRESYKSRIYMDKDIVFWGGFHPLFHIHYDYSQDARTLRQKKNLTEWKEKHHIPTPQEIKEAYSSYVEGLHRSKNSKKKKSPPKENTQNTLPVKYEKTQRINISPNKTKSLKKQIQPMDTRIKNNNETAFNKRKEKIAQPMSMERIFNKLKQKQEQKKLEQQKHNYRYQMKRKKIEAIKELYKIMQQVAAKPDRTKEQDSRAMERILFVLSQNKSRS